MALILVSILPVVVTADEVIVPSGASVKVPVFNEPSMKKETNLTIITNSLFDTNNQFAPIYVLQSTDDWFVVHPSVLIGEESSTSWWMNNINIANKHGSNSTTTSNSGKLIKIPTRTHRRRRYRRREEEGIPIIIENGKLEKTSIQAHKNDCIYATNGGPFNIKTDSTPVGGVIINGRIISPIHSRTDVGFGITKKQRSSQQQFWVIGSITTDLDKSSSTIGGDGDSDSERDIDDGVSSNELLHYVTGFNWLVYNGTTVASQFDDTTGASYAPRTAIGVDSYGRLILVVTDGCEKCLIRRRQGYTLEQFAEILQSNGALYAINLDGGGSSTMTDNNNQLVSRPLCDDVPLVVCERPVSTVMCLRK